MDVCAEPAPPPPHPGADPAEEDAFYRAGVRQFSEIALRLADRVEHADEPTLPEKVEAIERLARVFRRNALMARHLREPVRPTHPPGSRRSTARAIDDRTPLSKLSDAELEALEAECRDRLDPLDSLEDVEHDPVADLIGQSRRDLGRVQSAAFGERHAATPRDDGPASPPASPAAFRHPDPPNRNLGPSAADDRRPLPARRPITDTS